MCLGPLLAVIILAILRILLAIIAISITAVATATEKAFAFFLAQMINYHFITSKLYEGAEFSTFQVVIQHAARTHLSDFQFRLAPQPVRQLIMKIFLYIEKVIYIP